MTPEHLIADLDADQRRAVTSDSHLVAVLAGAGSGKTRVLTRRIAYRIAMGEADPRHTLALTFTREAAGELRRRLARLGIRDRVEAGTFHSVMLGVLKQRWTDIGQRPLTVRPDRRRVVADALDGESRRGIDVYVAEIDWAAARGIGADNYASTARRAQRRPSVGIERCAQVYENYERLKRRRGIIDFDDVLGHVIKEIVRDHTFGDALRWRFRHLLVDEAQDLNPLQHRIIDLVRRNRDDLFLVGDPSQAIFGFNGADPTLLVDVENRFPGVEIFRLPVNHRSTPQIVASGVHVLTASGQPAPVVSQRGDGPSVERLVAIDEHHEATHIARAIATGDPNLVRTSEVAILARTNAQLSAFADELEQAGLDVRRSANASGSPLAAAVRHVAAIGSANQLRQWAHDTLEHVDELHSAQALLEDATTNKDRRRLNSAKHTVAELEAERRVAAALLEYLRDTPRGDGSGFRAWVAMTNPFDDRQSGGVELLTFHAAKGREWNTVFVTGVESSLMPIKSATTAADKAEEGRLLYVAITRATDRLTISRAERRGGYARTESPFVGELDLSPPTEVPPPSELRRPRSQRSQLLGHLRQWRDDVARRVDVLPSQLCGDHDLSSIADARPTTVDELVAATSFGEITAARLAPELLAIVARQSQDQSMSTITGA